MGNIADEFTEAAASDVSTTTIDAVFLNYTHKRAEHERVKKLKVDAYNAMYEAQEKLMALLDQSGKDKWELAGEGKVSVINKRQVRTPKDAYDKMRMIDYFREQGTDTYYRAVGVHSATLNSYFNEQVATNPEFRIPGVGEPTNMQSLRFTRSKK